MVFYTSPLVVLGMYRVQYCISQEFENKFYVLGMGFTVFCCESSAQHFYQLPQHRQLQPGVDAISCYIKGVLDVATVNSVDWLFTAEAAIYMVQCSTLFCRKCAGRLHM